jgi:tetratricopeptide (TPR) repeat protein
MRQRIIQNLTLAMKIVAKLSSPNIKNSDKADDNIDTGDTVSSFEDTTDDSSKMTKRNDDGEIVKVDDEGENEVDMDAVKIAENNEESVTVPQNNENEAGEQDNDDMEDIDTAPLDSNRLSEQNIKDIARLCQGNAAICKIIMLSLKQPDIKARLLPVLLVDESASNNNNNNNNNNSENNSLSEDTANGDAVEDRKVDESAVTSSKPSPEQTNKAQRSLMLAVDSLQPMHKQVLAVASKFSTSFSCSELQALIPEPETVTPADEATEDGEEKIVTIETALADLRRLGYMTGRETRRGTRYCLQTIVRTTLLDHQAKQPQQQSSTFENELANAYVALFVGKLTDLKERFFSRDSISAFIDFSEDMDSINDFLLDISLRDSVYDVLRQSASLLYVVFLTTLLPEITYVRLYSRLAEVAERQEDVTTQAAALSCMAWYQLVNQQYVEARKNLETAMDAQLGNSYGGQRRTLNSATVKAFCQLCQARLLWIEQQEKAIDLAREAVEDLQTTLGRTDITTLIASEIHDMMLIDRSSSVNRSVTGEMSEYPLETALGAHPLLLRSYGSRRLLWDKFCLFQRACDMANKAVDIARLFYADHPLTADALVLLSSSYVKLGAIPQALDAAITALAIRQRTLGSHDKTAAAYAMIARILRRACLYEDAVVFAKHALDLYNELDGGSGNTDAGGTGSSSSTSGSINEAARADVRNIIIQCLAKQQRRQANAVRGPASNRQSALSPTTPGSTPSSGIVSPSSPLNPPFGNLGPTLASSTAGKPGPGFRVNGNLQRAADSPDGHAPTSPTILSRSEVVAREGSVTREAPTPNAASGVPVRPSSRTGITAHEMSMSRSQDLSKQQQQLSSRITGYGEATKFFENQRFDETDVEEPCRHYSSRKTC